MTCLLYELPYMYRFSIKISCSDLPRIRTFLILLSRRYSTAASRARPSESYRKFLALLDRSYLLSRLSHRPLDFRHPTPGIQHLGHFPHLNPQQQEQTPLIKQMSTPWWIVGALSGASSVAFGAFGAHGTYIHILPTTSYYLGTYVP